MFTPRRRQTRCEAHSCTDSDTKRTFRLEELHTSESFCRQEDMTRLSICSYPTIRSCWDWSLTKLTGRELRCTADRQQGQHRDTDKNTHSHPVVHLESPTNPTCISLNCKRTRAPDGNPSELRENTQTSHRKSLSQPGGRNQEASCYETSCATITQ